MWKKIFYGASKKFANDVSRVYGEEKKKQAIQSKKEQIANDVRRETISEYKQDLERQQSVKDTDKILEFLIRVNNVCNQSLKVLEDPNENWNNINLIISEEEDLAPLTTNMLINAELEGNEYYQQLIEETVQPYFDLREILFGDFSNGESEGLFTLIMQYLAGELGEEEYNAYHKLIPGITNIVHHIKERIREVFERHKRHQITLYSAYGISGEVDFGTYTIKDLE